VTVVGEDRRCRLCMCEKAAASSSMRTMVPCEGAASKQAFHAFAQCGEALARHRPRHETSDDVARDMLAADPPSLTKPLKLVARRELLAQQREGNLGNRECVECVEPFPRRRRGVKPLYP